MRHIFTRIMSRHHRADPQLTPAMPDQRDPETVFTEKRKVACDGPEFSRHPRIYLNMAADNQIFCPYCSRLFKYDGAE